MPSDSAMSLSSTAALSRTPKSVLSNRAQSASAVRAPHMTTKMRWAGTIRKPISTGPLSHGGRGMGFTVGPKTKFITPMMKNVIPMVSRSCVSESDLR